MRKPVDVRAGMPAPELESPVLHSVTFVGESAGPVWVEKAAGATFHWRASLQIPSEGARVPLDGLPAGEYTVRSGSRQVAFRVPEDAEVSL